MILELDTFLLFTLAVTLGNVLAILITRRV